MPAHDRPYQADVRWDHAAAEAAIGALRRAADALDATAADCAHAARGALVPWLGQHRFTFELRRRSLDGAARTLAADCRAAAGGIAAADCRAREEQARREREREAWERRERERQRQSHGQPQL